MAKIRYDHWHHLLGENVFVTIGSRVHVGELVGLKALHPDVEGQRRVEWAWALQGARRTVFFDPDNPAVVVHRQRVHDDALAAQHDTARVQAFISEANELVDRARKTSERAAMLIQKHNALLGITTSE